MSAAQKRAVGTLIFGAYNMAIRNLRQEKFHDMGIFFSECDVNYIMELCGVFKKVVELFRTEAYVEASIRPKHRLKRVKPNCFLIWRRRKNDLEEQEFRTWQR